MVREPAWIMSRNGTVRKDIGDPLQSGEKAVLYWGVTRVTCSDIVKTEG